MDHITHCKMQNYKILKENMKRNLGELGFDHNFIDTTPKARLVKKYE